MLSFSERPELLGGTVALAEIASAAGRNDVLNVVAAPSREGNRMVSGAGGRREWPVAVGASVSVAFKAGHPLDRSVGARRFGASGFCLRRVRDLSVAMPCPVGSSPRIDFVPVSLYPRAILPPEVLLVALAVLLLVCLEFVRVILGPGFVGVPATVLLGVFGLQTSSSDAMRGVLLLSVLTGPPLAVLGLASGLLGLGDISFRSGSLLSSHFGPVLWVGSSLRLLRDPGACLNRFPLLRIFVSPLLRAGGSARLAVPILTVIGDFRVTGGSLTMSHAENIA